MYGNERITCGDVLRISKIQNSLNHLQIIIDRDKGNCIITILLDRDKGNCIITVLHVIEMQLCCYFWEVEKSNSNVNRYRYAILPVILFQTTYLCFWWLASWWFYWRKNIKQLRRNAGKEILTRFLYRESDFFAYYWLTIFSLKLFFKLHPYHWCIRYNCLINFKFD